MFDFRLQVFYTVAKRLNFTKAAAELYISQPAVTKHIHELENHFKSSLFERSGNKKIILTSAGESLLKYAEQLFPIYQQMEFHMNTLVNEHSGELHIGASNTVSQYVIPPILAQFHNKFKNIKVTLTTGNTEQVEENLLNKNIELGIIEGLSRNPQISYKEYLEDELVLVSRTNNPFLKKDTLKTDDLKNYSFLVREHGSGSLDVIAQALKSHNIKLQDLTIEMQLGGAESIKSYLMNSNCLAFLSVHSIIKELRAGAFRIIDIKGLSIERPFYFIQPHGQPAPLAELFIKFTKTYKQNQ